MENNPSTLTDNSQPSETLKAESDKLMVSKSLTGNPQPSEAVKAAPDNLMVFKRTHVYALLLPLAFVAGLAFGYIFWGKGPNLPTQAPVAAAANT